MENKIIINERIVEIFEKVMQNNDEIKRALEPKYSVTKKAAYNRAVINALFTILKATSGLYYEDYVDKFIFFNFVGCHIRVSNEKLNIDLNKCVDDIGAISAYFSDQVSRSDEFYRIIKEELDNFYGKNNKPYPNLGYFASLFSQQQINEQQALPPIYNVGSMFYTDNPYVGPRDFGNFESCFNQQQTQAINEIYNKIPLFGPNGKPMNKSAEDLLKATDRRIAEYEKTKARNRRKLK